MSKPTLLVDFDGVCHSYTSGWQGAETIADPPVPGLFPFLVAASAAFELAIFSSRSHEPGGISAMRNWFAYWATLESEPLFDLALLTFPTTKPAAFLTLDDRAVCFTGVWPEIGALRAFRPWYKQGRQPGVPATAT